MARSRCGWLLLPWIALATMPRGDKLADDLVGAMLGAAEHQRPLDRLVRLRKRVSSAAFSAWLTKVTVWAIRSTVVAAGVTALRPDRSGKRRQAGGSPSAWSPRRTGSGASCGTSCDDPLQRMDEAQVEHLVGLVEDEDFEPRRGRSRAGRPGRAGGPAWRRGRRGRAPRRARSSSVAVPPKTTPTCSRDVARIGATRSRRSGWPARGSGRAPACGSGRLAIGWTRGVREPVERRQHERRGLAGAGLGDAQQVAAGQDGRDRLRLDRRRHDVIFRRERVEEGLREPEVGEFGQN